MKKSKRTCKPQFPNSNLLTASLKNSSSSSPKLERATPKRVTPETDNAKTGLASQPSGLKSGSPSHGLNLSPLLLHMSCFMCVWDFKFFCNVGAHKDHLTRRAVRTSEQSAGEGCKLPRRSRRKDLEQNFEKKIGQ